MRPGPPDLWTRRRAVKVSSFLLSQGGYRKCHIDIKLPDPPNWIFGMLAMLLLSSDIGNVYILRRDWMLLHLDMHVKQNY